MATIRQNDSGFTVRLTVVESATPVDVSAAACQIVLYRPKGAAIVRPATFTTDGTDGQIEYIVQPGEISTHGAWSAQAHCVFPSGLNVRSERAALDVEAAAV